jgi:2,3-bisphosphoglycerate-dependent phosphoglycerate mutase
MPKMILLRHGQSLWNKANLFTGWVDVPLSKQGIAEAIAAGKTIAEIPIDCVFTSLLIRAQMTALLALNEHNKQATPVLLHQGDDKMSQWSAIPADNAQDDILPVHLDWRLNERAYGDLQGADKQAMRDKYGDEQVNIWRRSYDVPPPGGESLQMTAQRTIPCLQERILPELKKGHTVLVSAHGNSLRSIVMEIEGLSKEQVLKLEIATGQPIIYEYNNNQFEKLT